MKRVIAAALLLCIVLTGCGAQDDGTIVGTWEHTVDVADGLIDSFVDGQAALFFEIDEVMFTMTVTFGEDGTYRSVLNTEKSQKSLQNFVDAWYEATKELYAALLEQNESEFTVEDMLADFEEYNGKGLREALTEQVPMETLAASFKTEGTYRVEGDKLYRSEDTAVYEEYMIENGALYILSSSDPDMSEEDAAGYPYKFERVV